MSNAFDKLSIIILAAGQGTRMKSELRGRVLQETSVNLDIPATILDLATVPVPAKYQGAALTPLLAGSHPKNWRTDFYVEHHSNPATIAIWFGVRDNRYAYANYYQNGTNSSSRSS